MKKPLSLVEMAIHGYDPARVNKGSWLEYAFGTIRKEVGNRECAGRLNSDKKNVTKR